MITEEEEYQHILDNPLPTKANFIESKEETVLSSCGSEYTQTVSRLYSGTPIFVHVHGDIHDSYWTYPKLSERVVAAPHDMSPAKDHAAWVAAKNNNKREK